MPTHWPLGRNRRPHGCGTRSAGATLLSGASAKGAPSTRSASHSMTWPRSARARAESFRASIRWGCCSWRPSLPAGGRRLRKSRAGAVNGRRPIGRTRACSSYPQPSVARAAVVFDAPHPRRNDRDPGAHTPENRGPAGASLKSAVAVRISQAGLPPIGAVQPPEQVIERAVLHCARLGEPAAGSRCPHAASRGTSARWTVS